MVGIWLLLPEHLRLGTWDLLRGWTGQPTERVEPRLAMQLVHEAAVCATGIRERRCLSQKGFELANGLAFVAADQPIHELLDEHTVSQAQNLQVALGHLRRASGHFKGKLLAIDPHRMPSHSKRQMRRRKPKDNTHAYKMAQTFFCLDAETEQPICFTSGSSSRSVTQATPELLDLTKKILGPKQQHTPLVLADSEHFTVDLFAHLKQTAFDLLVPMPHHACYQSEIKQLPPETFCPRWSGLATATRPYLFGQHDPLPLHQYIQRTGDRPQDYRFKAFLATSQRDELEAMCDQYPQRWHVEEFFNANQALGWKRAGTLNLNIRYAQMTMALVAQTVIHQLRQRLGEPFQNWDAQHFAKSLFQGLDGDIRVHDKTIVVTYYNAPNASQLQARYENLPSKLRDEGINPAIPWLYDFMLDFRFK